MSKTSRTIEQRRNFFRREIALQVGAKLFALPGQAELPPERDMPVRTVNLSAGGVLLLGTGPTPAAERLCEGALIDLSISSFGSPLPIRLLGRVVRVEDPGPDELRFAVEFILITPSEADTIVRNISL